MQYYGNILDNIRVSTGAEDLKYYFNELLRSDLDEAITVINNPTLQFPTLFLLQPEIREFKISNRLSHRNKIALSITNEILSGKDKLLRTKKLSDKNNNHVILALKWIFVTGISNDGLNKDFDKVLDITTVLLAKECKDTSVLPRIITVTFERYTKDCYFYDLIWAFFQSRSPQSLVLIAPYILSKDEKHVELATRLLNFIPGIDLNSMESTNKRYLTFMKWIKENHPFLYFTGESFQRRYDPKPYIVILEGKYLCKAVSVNTGNIINPLTDRERQLLKEFKKETEENKKALSEFSLKLYKKNIYWWNKWINSPFDNQLNIVNRRRGDLI